MANQDGLAERTLRAPGLKFVLICALTVAMAVPLFFIHLVLGEREDRAAGAIQDIAAGWGASQSVAGPVLLVPYIVEEDGRGQGDPQAVVRRVAVVLPETLDYTIGAKEQTRQRGIFKVPVYRADVGLRATFDKGALAGLAHPGVRILWREASLALVVSDAHGLADNVSATVNGTVKAFQPGGGLDNRRFASIETGLGLEGPQDLAVVTHFALRGSRELSFAPLGRRTTATVESGWSSPSFFGTFLPSERKVTRDGFTASWIVPYLARGYGQVFSTEGEAMGAIRGTDSGVRFYQPVDHYQLVERSLKYAVMFIALAFLVFFVVETVSPRRLHAMHYALVGAAQALFYLLLLSFAEHIGFGWAYLAATVPTVALTTAYAMSVLADRVRAGVLGGVLATLYGLLYVILNAEDYSLVIGSSLLFGALAATMYVTRKVDWYRATQPQLT